MAQDFIQTLKFAYTWKSISDIFWTFFNWFRGFSKIICMAAHSTRISTIKTGCRLGFRIAWILHTFFSSNAWKSRKKITVLKFDNRTFRATNLCWNWTFQLKWILWSFIHCIQCTLIRINTLSNTIKPFTIFLLGFWLNILLIAADFLFANSATSNIRLEAKCFFS